MLCLACLPIQRALTTFLTYTMVHDDTYDNERSEVARREQAARLASLQQIAETPISESTIASTDRRTLPDQTLRAMPWYNLTVYNPHLAAPHPPSQGLCWSQRCPDPDTVIQPVDLGSYPTMSGMVMRRPELHQACHTTLFEPYNALSRAEAHRSSSQQTTESRRQ